MPNLDDISLNVGVMLLSRHQKRYGVCFLDGHMTERLDAKCGVPRVQAEVLW